TAALCRQIRSPPPKRQETGCAPFPAARRAAPGTCPYCLPGAARPPPPVSVLPFHPAFSLSGISGSDRLHTARPIRADTISASLFRILLCICRRLLCRFSGCFVCIFIRISRLLIRFFNLLAAVRTVGHILRHHLPALR